MRLKQGLMAVVLAAVLIAPTTASAAYTPAPGWAAGVFSTGYATATTQNGRDFGPVGLVFDKSGNFYTADGPAGDLYVLPPSGGAVGPGNRILHVNGSLTGLTYKSPYLYAGGVTNGAGVVAQLNTDGSFAGIVASQLPCKPLGLAIDPRSKDLFFACGTTIYRQTGTPGGPVSVYATRPYKVDGLAFDADGRLFDAEGNDWVVMSAATTQPNAGTELQRVEVPGADGVVIWVADAPHGNAHICVNRQDGTITCFELDIGTMHVQRDIGSGGTRGDLVTVGPDGCFYADQSDLVIRITKADLSCPFLPVTPDGVAPSHTMHMPSQRAARDGRASVRIVNPAGYDVRIFRISVDGHTIARGATAPFTKRLRLSRGVHVVSARVLLSDGQVLTQRRRYRVR